tara:strand:- start:126 stop:248 length:123 start_codon:yes stop_codon:yes gene_type:complete
MNNKKRIEKAEERILELQALIEHWKANDRNKQVRQERTLS